jgi:hypothetical protein
MTTRKPLARSDDLVIEELEDELLVYDKTNTRAHCLGATAARVWRASDGETDVDDLASSLELDRDTVVRAIEELQSTGLLESPSLQVLNGNGNGNGHINGNGITRRQLGKRGAQAGAAVAAAPLILSITAPAALATLTVTPFQCELYTSQDCGSGGCGGVAGCCCCCQGSGSCKTCGAINFCRTQQQPCAPIQGGGFGGPNCSDVSNGNAIPTTQGCCGVAKAKLCGCGWGPHTGAVTPSSTSEGCCLTTTNLACDPGSANCVVCCHGQPILSSAKLGCCTAASTNCCAASPAACCGPSTINTDCCVASPPACCATNSCP